MNVEGWISYRYLKGNRDRFVSVINFVSMTGFAIGVMALIVVIGVMSGFDEDLREKIVGTNADIVVEKESGIRDYAGVAQTIRTIDGVRGVSPYVNGHVFLESGGQASGVMLRGIDPATISEVTRVKEYLREGSLQDVRGDRAVIIGSEMARYYGYAVGDALVIIAPGAGMAGEGWRHELEVAGIFSSGMFDFDMNLMLTNIPTAQKIFDFPSGLVSGLSVKVEDMYRVQEIKKDIHRQLGYIFLVRTWIESNRNFFAALKLEKFAMFIILTLIVLVASFNIISTLIVTVTTKVKDIGILKSIGMTDRAIRRTFTLQGFTLGLVGTFWGVIGGVGLSLLLKRYQFIQLPAEIYYIDKLPVLLKLSDILMIVGAALLISYMATLYPAAKAARLTPVDALRYE